jgi:hypothetical protein
MREARVLIAFGLLVACTGEGEPRPDSSAVVRAPAAPAVLSSASETAVASAPADPCPKWGAWRVCSAEDRLTRAGLVFERDPKLVRYPFMRVPGIRYRVFRAEAHVFIYPSVAARVRDTDALDTATVSPRGGRRILWPEPATLATSGNLAAIVLSLNARQAERIALAFSAGLPPNPP